ncbi:hypothetical protein EG329_004499 [Mollisiaceae sp. DMI_Dod_QoI]|nr:hypothetical protein EG329_004499 [Helotiales sp. DMI_Dod_QoI]
MLDLDDPPSSGETTGDARTLPARAWTQFGAKRSFRALMEGQGEQGVQEASRDEQTGSGLAIGGSRDAAGTQQGRRAAWVRKGSRIGGGFGALPRMGRPGMGDGQTATARHAAHSDARHPTVTPPPPRGEAQKAPGSRGMGMLMGMGGGEPWACQRGWAAGRLGWPWVTGAGLERNDMV